MDWSKAVRVPFEEARRLDIAVLLNPKMSQWGVKMIKRIVRFTNGAQMTIIPSRFIRKKHNLRSSDEINNLLSIHRQLTDEVKECKKKMARLYMRLGTAKIDMDEKLERINRIEAKLKRAGVK